MPPRPSDVAPEPPPPSTLAAIDTPALCRALHPFGGKQRGEVFSLPAGKAIGLVKSGLVVLEEDQSPVVESLLAGVMGRDA
jgi:hypothetical protein